MDSHSKTASRRFPPNKPLKTYLQRSVEGKLKQLVLDLRPCTFFGAYEMFTALKLCALIGGYGYWGNLGK